MTYPTLWHTDYTYVQERLGTELQGDLVNTYRVSQQNVFPNSGPKIRRFDYTYSAGPGDQILSSTIKAYNGTSIQRVGYTDYTFSYAGMTRSVSDANHQLVSGIQQRFGVQGEIAKEIILVTDALGTVESYTNFYRYDLWGNLIYSRRAINTAASWYHETFNAFYNNGLQPGFNAFQDTFSLNQEKASDNPWNVNGRYWTVKNGQYNGTWTGGKEKANFVWADIGKTDVSIQARVYVGRLSDGPGQSDEIPRFGIIAHYPGSGTNKWALTMHPWTGNSNYLELFDEPPVGSSIWDGWLGETQPGTRSSCYITLGSWYTLNMTIHGRDATGWAQADGQPPCATVNGTFPASSSALGGMEFGLYAGGYSTLYDDVRVSTVVPYITTTGFSKQFIPSGAPGADIHGASAGTAQLQNGTGSTPIESYFGYDVSGSLTLAKSRFESSTGVRWLSATNTYDSFGNLKTSTGPNTSTSTSYFEYSSQSPYNSAYMTNQTVRDGPTQITTLYAYDANTGSIVSTRDPNLNTITYQYDFLNRPTGVTYPPGLGFLTYAYNDQQNYVNATNEKGWRTRQVYDGLGRLVKVERFSGVASYSTQTYSYNWANKVKTATDPMGNVTQYQYDALGRATRVTKPDGNFTLQIYDDVQSTVSVMDESDYAKVFYYDRLGRMTGVAEQSKSKCVSGACLRLYFLTSYYYDEVGNLVKVSPLDRNEYFANPGFETNDFSLHRFLAPFVPSMPFCWRVL